AEERYGLQIPIRHDCAHAILRLLSRFSGDYICVRSDRDMPSPSVRFLLNLLNLAPQIGVAHSVQKETITPLCSHFDSSVGMTCDPQLGHRFSIQPVIRSRD